MIYSKTAHKYLFKAFYGRTNKNKYKLQILVYNKYYINIITMQNTISITKVLEE